jgi:hypothetical protein
MSGHWSETEIICSCSAFRILTRTDLGRLAVHGIGGTSRKYLRARTAETSAAPDIIHELITSGTASV